MDFVDAGDHLRELSIPPVTCFKKNEIKHITVPHLSVLVINLTLLRIFGKYDHCSGLKIVVSTHCSIGQNFVG
jgi:hypothetical protein